MGHEAEFSLAYSTTDDARLVERSLRPEVGAIQGDRTRASLDRESAVLTVTVSASDLVALRAGLNTWLTLTAVAERSIGAVRT